MRLEQYISLPLEKVENDIANHSFDAPKEMDVKIDINGLIARVNVTQHFTNPSNEWVNGVYVFPLPENAAVDHMRLRIGERIIEGQIKEKQEAKKTYQKAKKQGKLAARCIK